MANSNSYLISFNQQTSFNSMHATYPGRSIAALWKTAIIEQLLRNEHLSMEVVFQTKRDLPGFAASNKFDVQAKI